MYASLVGPRAESVFVLKPDLTPPPPPPSSCTADVTRAPQRPDAFLAKNYDENARRADRDPHGIFRTPQTHPQRSRRPRGLIERVIFAFNG